MHCDNALSLRPAILDKKYLLEQAGFMYEKAMTCSTPEDRDLYMGISAMLYHLESGFYLLYVEDRFDNRRTY